MKISELSRASGLPIPTVKYYLREGLLPGGTPTAPNQADYGEAHIRRLRLIRTLREIGGLEIERIRRVIAAIEDETLSRHDLFGVAERARESARASAKMTDDTRQARAEVDRFVEELGWQVRPDAGARQGARRRSCRPPPPRPRLRHRGLSPLRRGRRPHGGVGSQRDPDVGSALGRRRADGRWNRRIWGGL